MGGSLGWGAEPPTTRPAVGGRGPHSRCIPKGCIPWEAWPCIRCRGEGTSPQPLREARDARRGRAPHNPSLHPEGMPGTPCIPKGCQERLASGAGGREPPPSCIPSGCTALHPVQGGGNLPQPLREARDARVVGGSGPPSHRTTTPSGRQGSASPVRPGRASGAGGERTPASCIPWDAQPCIRCLPKGGKGCTGCGGLCPPSHRTPTPSGGKGCKKGQSPHKSIIYHFLALL